MEKNYEIKIGQEAFRFVVGKVSKQANGSVLGYYGGTAVIANAVMSNSELDLDFFPLTVNYFEKAYAAGKIPGGFIKREGRPSEREILIARLIDRPIRPLFPDNFKRELQITALTVSSDRINPPDILAINASSLALVISDIPFLKPIAAVRMGYIDNEFIVNPTLSQLTESQLDIVVAGTKDAIIMVEGGAKEVEEDLLVEACKIAHNEISKIIELFINISNEIGKEKIVIDEEKEYDELYEIIKKTVYNKLKEALFVKEKLERNKAIEKVKNKFYEELKSDIENFAFDVDISFENTESSKSDVNGNDVANNVNKSDIINEKKLEIFESKYSKYFDKLTKEIMRSSILEENKRADGRGLEDIRDISIELGLLPYAHGSALFTRGETQSLAITTLGTVLDEQTIDDIEGEESKRFMLHYNFPPFSVGEVGRYGSPGRREIGHGHLAERSLEPIIPEFEEFPYTIRVVSEILESNGSSSMASVCGGSLSLYAAGVPIKKQVAGIAMGLIKEDEKYAILSDIMGMEDHLGDMDFKVAGTKDGITGFQMDVKIEGISFDIFKEALIQAKKGRMYILSLMEDACKNVENRLSENAPKITIVNVDPDKIGMLIGAGGKIIKSIINETGSNINIEQNGQVMVSNKDEKALERTLELIKMYTSTTAEVDQVYMGTVKKVLPYGLLIEFLAGTVGLCHISEISYKRINDLNSLFRVGDKIKVRLVRIDSNGKYILSHKEFFEEKE